ncbi:hypothetical protein AAHB37_14315 [Glutamicibacter halophytocola]|uniref:hypothetical protein n=1 Tax=Glutamicibacter halophytocola TaxID=1933880 RepID=UPI0032193E8F
MRFDHRGLGGQNAQDVFDQAAAGAPAEEADLVQQRFERALAGLDLGDHVGDVLARGFGLAVDQRPGVGLQALFLLGPGRAIGQVLAGGVQLQRGGGHQARIDGGFGEVRGQLFEPRCEGLPGLIHAADQAVGLDEPVVGGTARNIQPVLQEGAGRAEGGAPGGRLAFGGGEVGQAGIGAGLGHGLQGGLVELVGAAAPHGVGDMDLRAGLGRAQLFGQDPEAGGVAGSDSGIAERGGGRSDQPGRGGQIGQRLGCCCAHVPQRARVRGRRSCAGIELWRTSAGTAPAGGAQPCMRYQSSATCRLARDSAESSTTPSFASSLASRE